MTGYSERGGPSSEGAARADDRGDRATGETGDDRPAAPVSRTSKTEGPDRFTLDALIANAERTCFFAAAETDAILRALKELRALRACGMRQLQDVIDIAKTVRVHETGCVECARLRAGLQLIADDEHRLMNVTARQAAVSILAGKAAHSSEKSNEQPSAPAVPTPLASHEPDSSPGSAAGADSMSISKEPQ